MGFFDALRPFIARLIAALVAGIMPWLTGVMGRELTADDQQNFVNFGITLALVVYAVVHKVINKWINPVDAASKGTATRSAE